MGDPTGSSRLPVDSRQWRAEVEVGRPRRRLLPQSRPEDGAGHGRGCWIQLESRTRRLAGGVDVE